MLFSGTFPPLALFHFYGHFYGGDLLGFSRLRKFLRTTIRYFLFIAVGLFSITHELVKSETRRVPLIGGYMLVIGASVFGIWRRSQQDADDEDEMD